MNFEGQIIFAENIPASTIIVGFEVYPVKENKEEKCIEKCKPAPEDTPEAYAVYIIKSVEKNMTECHWLADFTLQRHADQFATLAQSIYCAGLNETENKERAAAADKG